MGTKRKGHNDDTAIYKKKTDREGMLEMPSVFIGSAVPEKQLMWVVDAKSHSFIKKSLRIAPGLCTIIKEIVNNASDQSTLSGDVTVISVDIDPKGVITVINNGTGLPSVKHHKYTDTWTVQMCFTDFRTSSHYDRIGKKTKTFDTTDITGGAHGYGAKATVCFSKWFEIVTVDKKRNKKYSQRYENNMSIINPPKIVDYDCAKKLVFTRITFLPDYEKFEFNNDLTKEQYDSVFKITEKIAYDTAGTTSSDCTVIFNDDTSLPQTFEDYATRYLVDCDELSIITYSMNDYWRICIAPQKQKLGVAVVSLVNHIPIPRGGTHVNFILRKLLQCFKEDKKFSTLTETQLKRGLVIIIDCMIACPTYESQAKVSLKTDCRRFRTIEYKYEFPNEFKETLLKNKEIRSTLDTIIKSDKGGILSNVTKTASKLHGGLASYEPASLCDNVNRKKRTILFITEGISAKGSAMVARQVLGVDVVGIFPIRGKILNIKNASQRSVENSIIVTDLLRVVGIQSDSKRSRLKYDDIVFFTDQDDDGFHIRALLLLFFNELCPNIASSKTERLCYFSTPLVTFIRNKIQREFYSMKQLEEWCAEVKVSDKAKKSDNFRYCKGLGTIKRSMMKEYITDYDTHVTYITFDKYAQKSLDLAFNSMAQYRKLRKDWIANYDEDKSSKSIVSTVGKTVSVTNMINKQLIQFSMADNIRSIPDVMSGLKESQRKVLYSCFYKKPIQTRKPMIQVFGTIFKKALYHHGDSSLHGVICGMTQDYVGTNNVPYFDPDEGNYGTRVNCEPAAARYLNVRRNPIMDKIFVHTDYEILPKHVEQGIQIEPKIFLPIIPMLLVNGSTGIGTGFRTEILAYNPLDVVKNVVRIINKEEHEPMVPHYQGFTGDVIVLENEKYMFVGSYEIIGDKTIRIIELPVGVWTDSYKRWLENLCVHQKAITSTKTTRTRKSKTAKMTKGKFVKRRATQFQKKAHEALVKDDSGILVEKIIHRNTAVSVCIDCVLKCSARELKNFKLAGENVPKRDASQLDGIVNYFKLFRIVKQSLTVFNVDGTIYEFKNIETFLKYWVAERKKWYNVRKKYVLDVLAKELLEISNRARFIKLILEDKLVLKHKPRNKIIVELEELKFDKINESFNYLLMMHIDSVTKEKWEKLQKELELKQQKFETIKETKPTQMWFDDLQAFVNSFKPIDNT